MRTAPPAGGFRSILQERAARFQAVSLPIRLRFHTILYRIRTGMKPSDKRIRLIVATQDLVCSICREKISATTVHVLIRRPDRPDGRRVHADAHRSCAEKDLELLQ
jgi:hypothetical protein